MDLFTYIGKDFLIIVYHYADYWEVELLPDVSADMVVTFCKVGRRGAMRQSQLLRE
jgi:hypothetical protein